MNRGQRAAAAMVLVAAAGAQLLFLAGRNGPAAWSNASDRTAREYTGLVMKSARRDALVFVDHVADDTVAPPLYYQFEEGLRRDVFIFHRLYLAFPWWLDYMEDRARATGDALAAPEIDLEEEKARRYKVSIEEYERLREGKTLNTVSIDIQTRKTLTMNSRRRPVYINTPARFRRSVLSEEVAMAPAGFLFSMDAAGEATATGNSLAKAGGAPGAGGGVFDELLFDYFSERALYFHERGRPRDFATALENALKYREEGWVYGELCGVYKQMGDEAAAADFCDKYRESSSIDDLYQP